MQKYIFKELIEKKEMITKECIMGVIERDIL